MSIRIKKLTKTYGEGDKQSKVLDNIDLLINQGEFIALLGPSGSGKSTLLNMISGIDLPDTGEVIIHGDSIHRMSDYQRTLFRRRFIGFVFQFFNLLPTLTVIENVLFPLELCNRLDQKTKAEARQLIGSMGLEDKQNRYPEQLSGGEQQRVAIARAIIHQPGLLLADEPTGNLDNKTGDAVLSLLVDVARRHQMTMLVVTHSEKVAARADRILYLSDAKIH